MKRPTPQESREQIRDTFAYQTMAELERFLTGGTSEADEWVEEQVAFVESQCMTCPGLRHDRDEDCPELPQSTKVTP